MQTERMDRMTLDELRIGSTATITKVGGFGPLRRRLLDMGLTPKTKIMVRKKAPLGDPIEIFLRGYELTIRLEDANKIEISEVSA
jgi:Fe2+ transport system protein FeoA